MDTLVLPEPTVENPNERTDGQKTVLLRLEPAAWGDDLHESKASNTALVKIENAAVTASEP